ncbi:MAG: serine hydrolase [Steroidobacteraceae bacterium]
MRIARKARRTLLAGIGLILLGVVALALADPVFWDRYFRAYTFDSFVDHPFPEPGRLYPQERVPGQPHPRAVPVDTAGSRSIAAAALADAESFAERTGSTSLIVYHDGRIQFERYWRGATPDRPVYSFSMHKTVVALLIGIALADGEIGSVRDPLARYVPALGADERRRITLENALQMAGGFEPAAFPRNPFSKHVRMQVGTDLPAAALAFGLAHAPGTTFDYNGVNPTLLAMALERATGKRYATYLSEKLWAPLGNRDAAVWLDHEGGLVRAATSLFATPMDWLRLGEMLLNRGRVGERQVVPAAWIDRMTTPSRTNPLYGYLIWLGSRYSEQRTLTAFKGFAARARQPFVATDMFYLDGLGGQRVYVIPSRRMVIVRTGLLSRDWEDATLPNTLIGGIVESQEATPPRAAPPGPAPTGRPLS